MTRHPATHMMAADMTSFNKTRGAHQFSWTAALIGAACVGTMRAAFEYALAHDERFGIWGGLSERERRKLRKRAV